MSDVSSERGDILVVDEYLHPSLRRAFLQGVVRQFGIQLFVRQNQRPLHLRQGNIKAQFPKNLGL